MASSHQSAAGSSLEPLEQAVADASARMAAAARDHAAAMLALEQSRMTSHDVCAFNGTVTMSESWEMYRDRRKRLRTSKLDNDLK